MQPDIDDRLDAFWLDYAELYITNVCNLNCENCNRFNNFNFAGHQRYADYADIYAQWADIIQVKKLGIIGGEPMLNPDFPKWLSAALRLWPQSEILVITNGTQLNRWPELYDLAKKHADKMMLDINMHGLNLAERVRHDLRHWMPGQIDIKYLSNDHAVDLWRNSYEAVRDPSWPDCPTPEDFPYLPKHIQSECEQQHRVSLAIWQNEVYKQLWTNSDGVRAQVSMANYFHPSTLRAINGRLSLHNNDPEQAIKVCYSKTCHHFIKGKLYKCGPTALLPEVLEQFPLQVSDQDRDLIGAYVPAEISWEISQIGSFVDDLKQIRAIPQCKFCPTDMIPTKFEAGTKKIKWTKKSPTL